MQLSIFDEEDVVEIEQPTTVDYRLERNIARAAEFLVAFDICRRGYDCFTVGEGLRYDLVADIQGMRRVQVKMVRRAMYRAHGSKTLSYTFGKSHRSKGNGSLRDYCGNVELLALVAFDRQVILYTTPEVLKRDALHVAAVSVTPEISDLSWSEVMRSWGVE